MQQTLLALCAVAIFSVYALNSTRGEAAAELRTASVETEQAASAIARARLAFVERYAFDERDVGRRGGVRIVPTASPLQTDAGEDATDASTFDDIDDFNGDGSGFREVRTADAVGGAGLLSFDVRYSVRYVDPATLATSAVPTLAKEVTVRAVETPTPMGRPVGQARFSKVFTPAGMTSFRR